ncbi:cell division protein FtsA [Altericroceibacterium endophyticum]|uniref:Cell division protein FtsA n=1 Tax=Altericroceibacterium endophyticum TaxID=1808508 RepID=A0A6I4T8K7_9SPHN|nr:cell division protein FtsA [Altericroceibacterium endophyticum]MXO66451.1 cell division protein FtsA [Altericroceibacterium endophyticum]
MASQARLSRVFGAVNIGSFRVSAMIAGLTENGEMVVLGSGHRAAQGIKRGYVVDMAAATHAVRAAIEKAEKFAGHEVSSVWIGSSGAGLSSMIESFQLDIGGRRIEDEDIEQLLGEARKGLPGEGRMVLHAHPACYMLDGAEGVANPKGLYAERLGVDVHVIMADSAPVRNLREAVQNAHLDIERIVAAPIAAGYACLTPEERNLGVALVEFGAEVTNVALYAGGMLVDLHVIPSGSADITDAIASSFGIRRFQAERLKCVSGSANASPTDHREMVSINGPDDEQTGPLALGADDKNRIPRSELIAVITKELDQLMSEVGRSLQKMGFAAAQGGQVVLTGGGAELAGLADYTQSALGKPVRIGRTPALRGLPEAHAVPGFATLAGLVLYAAEAPPDILDMKLRGGVSGNYGGLALIKRIWLAMRDYF